MGVLKNSSYYGMDYYGDVYVPVETRTSFEAAASI